MESAKKRNRLVSLGVMLLLLFLTFFSYYTPSADAAGKTIVINPGHEEGTDSGAANGDTGITEVGLNNALAVKVVATLRNSGYNAMLSHQIPENTMGLPTLQATTTNNSTQVANAANKLGADLLISIHHNSGGSSASGYEFYWSSYHPAVDNDGLYEETGLWGDGSTATLDSTPSVIALKSKEFANILNAYFSNLDYVPSRNRIVERDDAFTRKTSMPSVLIEGGFVSNDAESLALADGNNQQKMANQIAAGVNQLFGTENVVLTADSVKATVSDTKVTAMVTGINAPNAVSTLYFPVWSDNNGQDDITWHEGIKQSDGSYKVTFDIAEHHNDTGTYNIHCYAADYFGKMTMLGATTADVTVKFITGNLTASATGDKINVKVNGIVAPNGLQTIYLPIWSETGGQDDIKWYTATKQSDGSYSLSIDVKDHNYNSGIYHVHCYGVDSNGKYTLLGEKTVSVSGSVQAMSASSVTNTVSGNQINVSISGIAAPNGIQTVYVPTWSEVNGQDDIKWYTATKQSDGSYSLTIEIKDHNNDAGVYNIHCYGVDDSGNFTILKEMKTASIVVEKMTAGSVKASVSGSQIIATIQGITAPNGIKTISVPVWSDVNGQDDLKWYTAVKQSDGSYQVTIDIKDHNYDSGSYLIHTYGTDASNVTTFLGNTSVSVVTSPMTANDITATFADNIITVNIDGITAPNGIQNMLVPTWSDNGGQDDIVWYTAIKQSDGNYQATINAKDHNGDSGNYSVHVYGVEADGRNVFLGNTSVSVRYVETPIMGATTVTAADLIAYYKATGCTFPQIYGNIGVNLDTFVNMYIQECAVEGVRAEVAFAQAMLETGNLQFGGDVKVSQFNFAGLGATGGVPGYDFSTTYGNSSAGLQTGIRGHVQHLKCYASDQPLNQTKVDPRWNNSLRLRALSVEELAGTWAADKTYAGKVKAIMNKF
ncbi:hypothetical protein GH808_08520 [Acetobacterium fimetarium]|uniref:MurNAc-LAA domain-containing protein n=1 Tax=Acetobacterium fimetarium TaxID=52691 RepID=A0ABR6WVT1_9FIRM|nr:GBS Bsp-like repeat-containing protein [Acetobacterium fimetarium]MBC3804475.1 hypothetical protein [Acetobacterium fimetarium]